MQGVHRSPSGLNVAAAMLVFLGAVLNYATAGEAAAGVDDAGNSATSKVCPSLITLQANEMPAGVVVAMIAKEMGYLSACARPLKGKTITCSYKDKPAWECMVDIFERFDVTFATAGRSWRCPKHRHLCIHATAEEQGALHVHSNGGNRNLFAYATQGPFLLRFCQLRPGTILRKEEFSGFETVLNPSALSMTVEPKLAYVWRCEKLSFQKQKNHDGIDCDLLGLSERTGSIGINPNVELARPKIPQKGEWRELDEGDRWPGLQSFEVQGVFRFGGLDQVATLTGLEKGQKNRLLKTATGEVIAKMEEVSSTEHWPMVVNLSIDHDVGDGSFGGGVGYSWASKLGLNAWFTYDSGDLLEIGTSGYDGVGKETLVHFNLEPNQKKPGRKRTINMHAVRITAGEIPLLFRFDCDTAATASAEPPAAEKPKDRATKPSTAAGNSTYSGPTSRHQGSHFHGHIIREK